MQHVIKVISFRGIPSSFPVLCQKMLLLLDPNFSLLASPKLVVMEKVLFIRLTSSLFLKLDFAYGFK